MFTEDRNSKQEKRQSFWYKISVTGFRFYMNILIHLAVKQYKSGALKLLYLNIMI